MNIVESCRALLRSLGGAMLIGSLVGCIPLRPVPHPPWVEDVSLALVRETLRIDIGKEQVDVDARLTFSPDGFQQDRVATFPVVGEVEYLSATLRTLGDSRARQVRLHKAPMGQLPVKGADRAYDLFLPGDAFAAGDVELRVRYRQRLRARFVYVLDTGAYWHGPIGFLEVIVVDRFHRVQTAQVEDQPAHRGFGTERRWWFWDIEPRHPVVVTTRLRALASGSVVPFASSRHSHELLAPEGTCFVDR